MISMLLCLAQLFAASEASFFDLEHAVHSAAEGDTVWVPPGTYQGPFDWTGVACSIIATGGPGVTELDGRRRGSVVTLAPGQLKEARLEGFTITKGSGTYEFLHEQHYYRGGGAYVSQGTVHFKDCRFVNNRVGWMDSYKVVVGRGGAISVDWRPTRGAITVEACSFEADTARSGGAIHYESIAPTTIVDSEFIGCYAEGMCVSDLQSGAIGGAIFYLGDGLELESCIFRNCNASRTRCDENSKGGAIYIAQSERESFFIRDNIFIDCSASTGGAAYLSSVDITFAGNILIDNAALPWSSDGEFLDKGGTGGGLYVNSDAWVERNTFIRNTALDADINDVGIGGACATGHGSFADNIVTHTRNGGGVAYYSGAYADHNLYWENTDGDIVGGAPPGAHDVFAAPCLDDCAVPMPVSPAIDAGSGRETSGIEPCGGEADIGAKEYCGPARVKLGVEGEEPPIWQEGASPE